MEGKEKGFTLVEAIIVISIMGIIITIAGVGVPRYYEFLDNNNLKIETRMVLQTILKARSDAIIDGWERRIYIYPEEDSFLIKKQRYPGDPPGERLNLSKGIFINNTTYIGGNLLELKPIGTVSRGGHITLKSPRGRYRTIVVQIGTGRIYMKEGMMDD